MTTNPQDRQIPLLTVAKGNPAPDELAALTAVVLSLQSAAHESAGSGGRRRNPRRRELLRPVVPFGPGAWRHTFR
ncbi:acyl-CoA carboxylase subunit epsilon [Arthrobacter sp. GCM10027362]|uniref:acyl-CoA carboxylase subunit epsilon n=1 Tax=Arthrobacter sp. GCM10027362 TaxID=3273379 RepID=UPI003631358A